MDALFCSWNRNLFGQSTWFRNIYAVQSFGVLHITHFPNELKVIIHFLYSISVLAASRCLYIKLSPFPCRKPKDHPGPGTKKLLPTYLQGPVRVTAPHIHAAASPFAHVRGDRDGAVNDVSLTRVRATEPITVRIEKQNLNPTLRSPREGISSTETMFRSQTGSTKTLFTLSWTVHLASWRFFLCYHICMFGFGLKSDSCIALDMQISHSDQSPNCKRSRVKINK